MNISKKCIIVAVAITFLMIGTSAGATSRPFLDSMLDPVVSTPPPKKQADTRPIATCMGYPYTENELAGMSQERIASDVKFFAEVNSYPEYPKSKLLKFQIFFLSKDASVICYAYQN